MIGVLEREQLDEVARWHGFLERVRYKPWWKLSAHPAASGGIEVRVRAYVQQAYPSAPGADEWTVVLHRSVIASGPRRCWEDYALSVVRSILLEVERHEFGEFFQLDGRRPFDPHAADGPE